MAVRDELVPLASPVVPVVDRLWRRRAITIEETIPDVVDVLLAKRDRPGLEYLDRVGRTVPW